MLWGNKHAGAATLLVAVACLSTASCSRLLTSPDLNSASPSLRAEAIVQQTEYCLTLPADAPERRTLVVRLVGLLDDEDDGVRAFAITGLEKLTGKRLGYAGGAPLIERRAAIDRWRAYLAEQGEQDETETPVESPTRGKG